LRHAVAEDVVADVHVPDDVLETMRVDSGMLFQTELAPPWGIRARSAEQLAFHVVTRGHGWLSVAGEPEPITVESGDVVVLAPGREHVLRDTPTTPARDIAEMVASGAFCRVGDRPAAAERGAAPTTQLVCGWFEFADPRGDVLLDALPAVLHAREQATDSGTWLAQTVKMLSYESRAGRPGMTTVLNRLCDALFVYVLRSHLAALPTERPSWLRALVDPTIGTALQLMHDDPAAPWTVAKLAAEVGMSRSAFSARFTTLVGEPAMQYLARWRLRKAATLLRDGDQTLHAIATSTGYSSAAAFSKAFAREHGAAPGAFRRTGPPPARPRAPRDA
jgi:AraC-like DNA-binding protein/quercetin dioxygenase-like cupin family protein